MLIPVTNGWVFFFFEKYTSDLMAFFPYFKQNSPTRQYLNVIFWFLQLAYRPTMQGILDVEVSLRLEEQDFDFDRSPLLTHWEVTEC